MEKRFLEVFINKGTLLCFVASCVGKTFEIMSEK